jgi:hypothetical protein
MAYGYNKPWERHTRQIWLRLQIPALSRNALSTSLKNTELNRMDLFVPFETIVLYGLFYYLRL